VLLEILSGEQTGGAAFGLTQSVGCLVIAGQFGDQPAAGTSEKPQGTVVGPGSGQGSEHSLSVVDGQPSRFKHGKELVWVPRPGSAAVGRFPVTVNRPLFLFFPTDLAVPRFARRCP